MDLQIITDEQKIGMFEPATFWEESVNKGLSTVFLDTDPHRTWLDYEKDLLTRMKTNAKIILEKKKFPVTYTDNGKTITVDFKLRTDVEGNKKKDCYVEVNGYGNESVKLYNLDDNGKINDIEHGFVQLFRIPIVEHYKLSIEKVGQLGYNVGQLLARLNSHRHKNVMWSVVTNLNLDKLSGYFDVSSKQEVKCNDDECVYTFDNKLAIKFRISVDEQKGGDMEYKKLLKEYVKMKRVRERRLKQRNNADFPDDY